MKVEPGARRTVLVDNHPFCKTLLVVANLYHILSQGVALGPFIFVRTLFPVPDELASRTIRFMLCLPYSGFAIKYRSRSRSIDLVSINHVHIRLDV